MNNSITAPERMNCMEIWGGNRAINKNFEAPGLDVYVHSAPYRESKVGGGDIYYLTSCASGRISRLLLADVSGHGEAASKLAISLRDLLRTNVNTISQERFVKEMNREFGAVAKSSSFATAVVATFFEPRKTLSLSVAGHPHPIYYRASKKRWVHLDPEELKDNGPGNLPLGILNESSYPGRIIPTEPGDMFLLYSDAFIESVSRSNQFLGIEGVLELLNQTSHLSPNEVIPLMREQIGSMAAGNLLDDDATMILGHVRDTKVRFRDNVLAPFRLLGSVGDKTDLEE